MMEPCGVRGRIRAAPGLSAVQCACETGQGLAQAQRDAAVTGDLCLGMTSSARRRNRLCRSVANRSAIIIPQYIVVEAWAAHAAPHEEANINAGIPDDNVAVHQPEVAPSYNAEEEVLAWTDTGDKSDVRRFLPNLRVLRPFDYESVLYRLDGACEELVQSISMLGRVEHIFIKELPLSDDLPAQRTQLDETKEHLLDCFMVFQDDNGKHGVQPLLDVANSFLHQCMSLLEDLELSTGTVSHSYGELSQRKESIIDDIVRFEDQAAMMNPPLGVQQQLSAARAELNHVVEQLLALVDSRTA